MKLSTQPYKGTRDFYPEDMRIQEYIFNVWRKVCERYGYEEYLTPLLEPTDIYLAKSSEEIVREQTYTFEDRGSRSVTIRPEMTPSVSRLVASRRQEFGYPLRLYSIANYMRYERMQRGRLREFWQLNVDVFGLSGLEAEFEVIKMADAMLVEFGAKRSMYEIRVNSRKFINFVLGTYIGCSDAESMTLVRLIDRMDKMSRPEFVALVDSAISPAHREKGAVDQLLAVLDATTLESLPAELQKADGLSELVELISTLQKNGVESVVFTPKLMRGFDYYTDIVFEAFDTHPDNNRAMFGGGRYDGLVGQFGVEPVPTFGFAPGDVAMGLFLSSHELLPKFESKTELYLALVESDYRATASLIDELRAEGISVAVDYTKGKKLGAQIKTAEKKAIRYVVVVGNSEIESRRFRLRDIKMGKETELSFERLVSTLKDARSYD